MVQAGPDEKIYPISKIAVTAEALRAEGVDPAEALRAAGARPVDLSSPAARVSLNQVLAFYRAALRLVRDWQFAFRAGRRFHVSAYGMYGFAMLSSTNFHRTVRFAERYHQLATPLADLAFRERDGRGEWTIAPLAHPQVDPEFYQFLVELQFGIQKSLYRDLMGPAFGPIELTVVYGPAHDPRDYAEAFGRPVAFNAAENKFAFDAKWLDETPQFGDARTYALVRQLCDQLMMELKRRVGVAGQVREALLGNFARRASFEAVAAQLRLAPRTLRRRLDREGVSFRKLLDELRTEMAIKYLRDTELSVEEVAYALGFSEAANFRQAFRRWTGRAPNQFRLVG